ncbi:MAG: PIG-L family deacetylase [Chloroflexi bacterium]|nr:PIG-L family deacetylase [Chloroflexota bacterium]
MTKTLLAVLAHPDDESFGLGGTLALYARKGYNVYLICATRGEVGTVDPEHMRGFQTIAELRESELRCAAEHLGLKDVFFLGYRDSGMPGTEENKHPNAQINHSLDEVAGKVVEYIRSLKPDIVLTFDPIGGYKHPDHIHIHKATTLAFEKADDASFHPESGSPFKPRALYYQIFPRWFLRAATRIMPLFGQDPTKFGRNHDINLKELADVDFPLNVRLDIRSVSETKSEAGACHASQGGMQMRRGLMGWMTRLFGENEDYMQAYPPIPKGARLKRDLFEGLSN